MIELEGGIWAPGRRLLTAGLVASITLVALESLSVTTVLPVIGRALGDVRLYGWVFSAFFLASLVGIAASGSLADRTGVTAPLAGGLALFAAGLVVGGAAPDMPVLVLGRAIQGLGAGAVPAAAYTAIGRGYPPGSRPRMFAVLSTAWVGPGVAGPSLAALVAAGAGWRWVLLGLVPVVVVAAAVCTPAVRTLPPPTEAGAAAPVAPSVAVAAGAGLVLAGLSAGGWPTAPLAIAGAALATVALRRLVPGGTLRAAPGLPAAVAARGVLTFGFFAADAYVPLTLTSVRHTSTAYGGAVLTVGTLTWTAGAWLQARLLARVGPRRMVLAGAAVVVAAVGLLATVLSAGVPVWVALVAWAVAGLGMGLAYAPISVTVLDLAPAGGEGRSTAAVQLTDTLGTALGTGAAGAAVALGQRSGWPPATGLGIAFALAAAVLLLTLACAARMPRRLQAGEHPAPRPG